jgi:glycosyltransferase involved in cell wall biosynthesis
MTSPKLKISLITVCFNSAATLGDTLRSVAEQTYPEIEHIIIDGGSTDNSLDVIKNEGSRVGVVVSEPDKGIYDAMNKGIALATGDVIGFINADDFYSNNYVLSKVADIFRHPGIDACYGDLCYVNQVETQSVVRYWRSSDFHPGLFSEGWCPPHPTFFVKRKIYQRFGCFDLSYRIAADVELMMRFLEVHRVRVRYLPEILVKMRMGGTTNKNLRNIAKQNDEILRALRKHGLAANLLAFFGRKIISRGKQFFSRPRQLPI